MLNNKKILYGLAMFVVIIVTIFITRAFSISQRDISSQKLNVERMIQSAAITSHEVIQDRKKGEYK